ncbi:MAG: hypothetical protein HZA23_00270 [Nitrospirae bacterium]|nr:hypothetical protein [Nitrospirota bacterium]
MGHRLDRVEWENRPPIPHATRRTVAEMEDLVLTVRRDLKEHSPLGEYGAVALRRALLLHGVGGVPSVPTINRILRRRGAFDAQRRVRRPPPPRGWYLPDVAQSRRELESFDIVEGLVIQGGPQVDVLTSIALHGGLVGAWPTDGLTARLITEILVTHWQEVGLPAYAQFDNDTRFHGPHHYPDVISSVMRLCLSLEVIPVFVPPREMGFQAAIESFNGRWQAKVWTRFHHASLAALQARSALYVAASRARAASPLESAPARRPFPPHWRFDLLAPLHGQLIFLRRTSEGGSVSLLGRPLPVARLWPQRLVRCEVDLTAERIRFYALRRRDPAGQPLLNEVPYRLTPRRGHP